MLQQQEVITYAGCSAEYLIVEKFSRYARVVCSLTPLPQWHDVTPLESLSCEKEYYAVNTNCWIIK
jgi:hypothetical protein